MQVLILAGRAAVGKDTAAEILESLYGARSLAQADKLKQLGQAFDFSREQLYGPSECRNRPDPRYVLGSPHWAIAERAIKGDFGDVWLEDVLPFGTKGVDFKHARGMLTMWFNTLKTRVYAEGVALSPRTMLQTLGTEFGREVLGEDVWSRYALALAEQWLTEGAPLVVFKDGRFPNECRAVRACGGKVLHLTEPAPVELVGGVAGHVSERALEGLTEFDAHVLNRKRTKVAFALDLVRAVVVLFPGLKQIKPLMVGEQANG